jgi:hypothetical protein
VLFVFSSTNVLYYFFRFAYVEQPLHPWKEAIFVMVNDLSDMLLVSVCDYFIDDFCIDVHQGDWSIVLHSGCVFVWFWDECNTGFIK